MANTAALLQNLLRCKADYNYAVLQQTMWASRQEGNASKLAAQQSAEEKWNEAYDKAYDQGHYGEEDKSIKCKDVTVKTGCLSEYQFSLYADAKVKNFRPDALEEYADLDTEYELMVSTYDAMVTQLDTMIQNYEEQVGTSAQDTGRLQS